MLKPNRITIIHNLIAGYDQPPVAEIIEELEQEGFEVFYCYTEENYYEQLLSSLNNPGDMVVLAGGDGTVKAAGEFLIDKNIPIAIIPLGTANNIAQIYGIKSFPLDQLKRYEALERKSLDVAYAKNTWGVKHFLESTGVGLLAHMMLKVKERKTFTTSRQEHYQDKLIFSLEQLKKLVKEFPAQEMSIDLDGKDLSGAYVFVEAMNIALMGPKLSLAPDAKPDDRLLDVVLLEETDRAVFENYIDRKLKGAEIQLDLPTYQGRKLTLEWHGKDVHIDGTVYQADEGTMEIEVGSGDLQLLIPDS